MFPYQINHAIMGFPWGRLIFKGMIMADSQSCAVEPGMCLYRLPSECQSLCHPTVPSPPPSPEAAAGAGEPRQELHMALAQRPV